MTLISIYLSMQHNGDKYIVFTIFPKNASVQMLRIRHVALRA